MRHGITYRGKHSNEFNTIVKSVGRPITPPVRQVDEEVPYRDGNVDCSETGGRLFYDDKVLQLEFTLIARNTTKLQNAVSKFINWLSGGYGELIFDDMPNVIWIAKPVDLDDMTILLYKDGKTTIQFRCHPFNTFVYDSKGIPIDSDIVLDSDIPLDFGAENEIAFLAGTSSYTLDYKGSAPVRPVVQIELSQGVQALTLTVNSAEIYITVGNTRSFTIDCENAVMPSEATGSFFELVPGENTIKIQSIGGAGNIIFEYKHNFIYGDGF